MRLNTARHGSWATPSTCDLCWAKHGSLVSRARGTSFRMDEGGIARGEAAASAIAAAAAAASVAAVTGSGWACRAWDSGLSVGLPELPRGVGDCRGAGDAPREMFGGADAAGDGDRRAAAPEARRGRDAVPVDPGMVSGDALARSLDWPANVPALNSSPGAGAVEEGRLGC